MKTSTIVLLTILFFVLLIPSCLFMKSCNMANNMVNDGMQTVQDELKPSALLSKYEWFKDASASCDQKIATLGVYETRFQNLKEAYGEDSLKRKNWSRSDIEQWNIWQSEYLGIKASYNDLASQYNANMVKINYAFCNKGSLPQGLTEPLPREYKPYITN